MLASKPPQKKVLRYAALGAAFLGGIGFLTGLFLCFHYKLPIPPLFLTEFGVLIGGAAGAASVYTGTEKRALPAACLALLTIPVGLFLECQLTAIVLAALLLGAAAWTLAEPSKSEDEPWKTV